MSRDAQSITSNVFYEDNDGCHFFNILLSLRGLVLASCHYAYTQRIAQ